MFIKLSRKCLATLFVVACMVGSIYLAMIEPTLSYALSAPKVEYLVVFAGCIAIKLFAVALFVVLSSVLRWIWKGQYMQFWENFGN